jgi:hypothetical protein
MRFTCLHGCIGTVLTSSPPRFRSGGLVYRTPGLGTIILFEYGPLYTGSCQKCLVTQTCEAGFAAILFSAL